MHRSSTLLLVLDLVGVAVFAASGALVGVRKRLDVFGIAVLALAAALGGGLVRDVLIGATPPAAFQDWRYFAVPVVVAVLVFFGHGLVERLGGTFRVFDAAGLALFCVGGTAKAMAFGLGPLQAAVMGMVTGIGGGVLRDLLVGEIPVVLQRELYAVPALLGSALVAIAIDAHRYGVPVAIAAAAVIFLLRMVSLRLDLNAPRPDYVP
ncbi:MAG: hypothetical protein QOJ92_1806 [Frankiales bacterium]|nr:hypothetical protein [Frankiales bacterium]